MNKISKYENIIDFVRSKYYTNNNFNWIEEAEKVKKCVVILTSSRSGSSLFKEVLTKSNNVLFTDGEETPYLILTKNEFPFVSSDLLHKINNKEELLKYIFADLGKRINPDDIIDKTYNFNRFYNRVLGQIPYNSEFYKLLREFKKTDGKEFLSNIFNKRILSFYDTFPKDSRDKWDWTFDAFQKIEDPPFVIPQVKNNYINKDLKDKPLIFKTPENAYKIGMFEKLFPNANIKYIYLTRGFAQTINGLMDGWLYDYGFFSKNLDILNIKLNIKNYSEYKSYGKKWWNFDFPPNWTYYINSPLHEVCVNQWASIHESILEKLNSLNYIQIKFENFISNPQEIMNKITDFINIPNIHIDNLDYIMITNKPKKYRWKKREKLIKELKSKKRIKNIMYELNYTMKEDTWI